MLSDLVLEFKLASGTLQKLCSKFWQMLNRSMEWNRLILRMTCYHRHEIEIILFKSDIFLSLSYNFWILRCVQLLVISLKSYALKKRFLSELALATLLWFTASPSLPPLPFLRLHHFHQLSLSEKCRSNYRCRLRSVHK